MMKCIKQKKQELMYGKYNIPLGSLMFLLGTIFGILIDDLTMGICIGLCLGCGSAIIVKRKDDDSKNN